LRRKVKLANKEQEAWIWVAFILQSKK